MKPILTTDDIEFYRSNGYIQIHDVLTAEELEEVRAGVDEVVRQRDSTQDGIDPEYAKVFLQMVNLWRINQKVKNHVFSSKLAGMARQLIGCDRVRLWHDHALIKLPKDSRESAWHQDYPYWPHDRPESVSCWMALDDVFPENGCMSFVPKSHTWGILQPISLGSPQDLFAQVPSPETKDFTPVPMPMKAGSCTFHHGLTFHYAGPNTTSAPRRAMVTIYMADGVCYSGAAHICTDGQGFKPGDRLQGELFPVLETP